MAGYRLGLIGATGAVGRQIVDVLGERRFPVASLRAFASDASVGDTLELLGEEYSVEPMSEASLASCELLFGASPVVASWLPTLERLDLRLVDVSGVFELDPEVPLYLSGFGPRLPAAGRPAWVGIPRGPAAGLGLVLGALSRETPLRAVRVCTLESAGGAGRRGAEALSAQTVEVLNAMTGDVEEDDVFPRPLAFDCLPQVGDLLEGGDTSEERRLSHVLRRVLEAPGLPVDVTRVRVPIFSGSLACVNVELEDEMTPERARNLLEKRDGVRVVADPELPSPRRALAEADAVVGRVRPGSSPRSLSFVIALDDLRRGAALGAVLAAEALVAS